MLGRLKSSKSGLVAKTEFYLSLNFTELLALGNEKTEFKFYFVKMDQNNNTYIYSLSIL